MNTTLHSGEHHFKRFGLNFFVYTEHHQTYGEAAMATGRRNNKSIQISVRLPLDDFDAIETLKADGESVAGFIVSAAQSEIKRRQRKKAKQEIENG
ncbi:YlcI/YnfO family protein [Serratia fonticola]|uniref:YlcI/YnfO family protein n=2 Tax=Serratia fonticola TaxID=47917 RepID=UPI00280ABC20|nr:YlcI/YnfO family protein [Serratia fonticola]